MAAKAWCRATRRSPRELRETGRARRCSPSTRPTTSARSASAMEFYQLGFEPVVEISAEHGTGVADLLDEIVKRLRRQRLGLTVGAGEARREADGAPPPAPALEPPTRPPSPSSAGRTSASRRCVNRLLQEERVLVSDMPGTTRDAIDAPLTWHRRRFRIVDTAGMRRPGRVRQRRAGGAGQRRRREEGDRRRRRRRAGDRRERGRRPIRMRRSAAKPTAPAAASSSSRTSGTW